MRHVQVDTFKGIKYPQEYPTPENPYFNPKQFIVAFTDQNDIFRDHRQFLVCYLC
jgi:hypothetical protein